MIDKILEISLRQRAFVLLAAFALLGVGLWSGARLPIDAVPDITGVQVQINTEVPALGGRGIGAARDAADRDRNGRPSWRRRDAFADEVRSLAGDAPIRRTARTFIARANL